MFTNEQSISDDDILPTDSTSFRADRVRERPIPSCPRIREESNEHPTIDTETDPPIDGNDDVSTTPRIDPTSFHIKLFEITTDDSLPDSSNGDPEITIALVHGDNSILLEDIVSMLLETIASLGDLASFFCCLLSSELSISEKSIHFNDSVEFVKENMQLATSCFLLSSEFLFTSDLDEAISRYHSLVFLVIAFLSILGTISSVFLGIYISPAFAILFGIGIIGLFLSLVLDLCYGGSGTLQLEPEMCRVIMHKKRSISFHFLCCCINTPTRNTKTFELSNMVSVTISPSTRRSTIIFNFVDGSTQSHHVTFKREEAYSFATLVNSMIEARFPQNRFLHHQPLLYNGPTPSGPYMHNPAAYGAYQSPSAPGETEPFYYPSVSAPDVTAPEELPGETPKKHEIS
ncbi:hypothetical protein BLNAU_25004 [Blattamonas nauphoetae]|uniref:Uncharacterized protein n=1 Tax=Blattamonas nauphoetae TaxID=2049346 RepID=A0ABQ9WMV0_9EUKA|nr:hypothetical protein BLNAU_25004 [Blattamonas nauphoetae]